MKTGISLFSVLGIVLALGLTFFLMGCGAKANTALLQGVNTDRISVVTTSTLLQMGKITPNNAKAVYESAVATEAGLRLWQSAIDAKDPAQEGVAAQSVSAGLSTLLKQLQEIQVMQPPAKTARAVRYKAPAPVAKVSGGEVASLIELAVQLAPSIEQLVASLFGTEVTTTAMINSAFTELDASLAALAAAIGKGTP